MLEPGALIARKLRVTRQLGAGGMGVVYEAIQVHLGRRVAVKVIHPRDSDSREARARFVREARAQAQLPLEHIVQVLDVDMLPDGDLYMVMEYLDGRDLKRELTKRGALPVAEAVSYLVQACTGIEAAHDAGIVHRDLKPQNLFLTNLEGPRKVKILDFGIAKMGAAHGAALTSSSSALGTPLYMSPEQLSGTATIDARADLWALGVVLFELLAGVPPFKRETVAGTLAAVLLDDPPPLADFRDDVPRGLEQVVECCLAKAPEARFADAAELAAALAPYAMPGDVVAPSVSRGSSAAPPPDLETSEALLLPPAAPRVSRLESSRDLPETVVLPLARQSREEITAPHRSSPPEPSALPVDRPQPERSAWRPVSLATQLATVGALAGAVVLAWLFWPRPAPPLPSASSASGPASSVPSVGNAVVAAPVSAVPATSVVVPTVSLSGASSPTPTPPPLAPSPRPPRPTAAPVPTASIPAGQPLPGDAVPLHL